MRPQQIPPRQLLTISVVCFVLFVICMALILSGCSVKGAQITYAGLQAGDLASTAYAESRGAVEANPVLQTEWPVRIAVKAAVTVLVLYGTSKLAREHQGLAKTVLIAMNAVLTGVIVNNVYVARTR